jgi:hypothetical protein
MEARVTKGGQGFGKVFEVLGETPVSSEPGEGALDHPTGAAERVPSRLRAATFD